MKSVLFSLLALLTPMSALASNLPLGGPHGTWTLYVYGDGSAIDSILTAIKLILDPNYGSQTFTILLLFLATVGFLVMAVRAGFDPGKNLLKMFMFVFVVFGVHYATSVETVNVHIHDRFGKPAFQDFYVSGVPAIVGIPAAVISDAGEYLTQEIEQVFQLPNNADTTPMALTTGGAYGIFEKVMQDANNISITDPDLKQSLSAYMTDCVVPAIALGKIPVSALVSSPNLVQLFANAENQGLMTKFYLTPGQQSSVGTACENLSSPGAGTLVSCTDDYVQCLYPELNNETNSLISDEQVNWQSTGIDTPLEQAMTSALEMVGADGSSNKYAGYSSPQGYIMQSAMLSASAGAFRHAAAAMGNNQLMMSAAMSQAEQSQRSSWWTAAQIFKDMMGYVFIVLQAFVFAMAPIVIICLMIPGLGAKVFVNYAEILVWLTLWTPLLAIVNFLAEIFGSSQLGSSLGQYGLNMLNKGLITEQTTNLVIVSQFMATMVPLLAWGLVKGSLAFTEFIMSGIGSSFAQQAGSQSATGNMSLGNESMGNVGFDKFSSVMSAAVGYQEVQAFDGVGRGLSMVQGGGIGATANAAPESIGFNRTRSYGITNKAGQTESLSESDAQSIAAQNQRAASFAKGVGANISEATSRATQYGLSDSAGTKWTAAQTHAVKMDAAEIRDASTNYKAALGLLASAKAGARDATSAAGKAKAAGLIADAKASMDAARQEIKGASNKLLADEGMSGTNANDAGVSVSGGNTHSKTIGLGEQANISSAEQINAGVLSSLSSLETWSSQRSTTQDWAVSNTSSSSESGTSTWGSAAPSGASPSAVQSAIGETGSAVAAGGAGIAHDFTTQSNINNELAGGAGHQAIAEGGRMASTANEAGITGNNPITAGDGAPIGGMDLHFSPLTDSCAKSTLMQNQGIGIRGYHEITGISNTDYQNASSYVELFSFAPTASKDLGMANAHLSGFVNINTHCLPYRNASTTFFKGMGNTLSPVTVKP